MDSILFMEHQVTNVCRECCMGIRDIGKIRHYLVEDTTKHLVKALVISKLDSNHALLYKVNKGLYDKLQLVQNNAARLIAKKGNATQSRTSERNSIGCQ